MPPACRPSFARSAGGRSCLVSGLDGSRCVEDGNRRWRFFHWVALGQTRVVGAMFPGKPIARRQGRSAACCAAAGWHLSSADQASKTVLEQCFVDNDRTDTLVDDLIWAERCRNDDDVQVILHKEAVRMIERTNQDLLAVDQRQDMEAVDRIVFDAFVKDQVAQ